MSISPAASIVKHTNSIRRKGRFRVRRVSRTPEFIKDNLQREPSSSPVKSTKVTTITTYDSVVPSPYLLPLSAIIHPKNEKMDVHIYNVSKLFAKNYDMNLASKYFLDESGKKFDLSHVCKGVL